MNNKYSTLIVKNLCQSTLVQEALFSKQGSFVVQTRTAQYAYRARTFKCLWGPGIDSKEWIPPAYVAWRAGTKTLFLLGA